MATAEKTGPTPAEAVGQSIAGEVLSLKTRADRLMTAFFADPQKRSSGWGDIVDMSNRVDLDNFISYRRNLVPENWRSGNKDLQQIIDGLIQEIDILVNVESRARHHIYLSEFARAYVDASLKIRETRKKEKLTTVNEFKLGYFLTGVQTGVPIAIKQSLFFACVASEYGNLALSEIDISRRNVLLKRARFFHQASLFEGKSSGHSAFIGDESMRGPVAGAGAEAGVEQVAAEWKEGLKRKGNELVKSLEDYIKEASLGNLVNLLERFTNLGVGVYLERPEAVGEEEFRQQAVGFDEAAEVMMGYFRQILAGSESLVFNPLLKTYDDTVGWSNHLKLYFDQAVAFDQLISESAEERQRSYAILGAAALARVGQLVFSRAPQGAQIDIEGLRKLYQEAVEKYLERLSAIAELS